MTQQLLERQARLRQNEDQLAVSRKEQDNLRFSNNNLLDQNSDLKAEIDALNAHCHVLQNQNRDLNVELERFIETDEQIRATLNRRERVMNLREHADGEIKKSQINVERASPQRRKD